MMTAELYDQVHKLCGECRHNARWFALSNPIAFYLTMGCSLPEYIKKIDDLESGYRRMKERAVS